MPNLIKISDFASLCGTTKDTLLYYDRHNLLKPAFISKSGYRYYALEQYYRFDYIRVLKGAGYDLSQVKGQLESKELSDNIMAKALVSLKRQRDEIDAKILMLESLQSVATDYKDQGCDRQFFKDYEAISYGFIQKQHSVIASTKETVNFLSQYLKDSRLSSYFEYQPVGTLIKKSAAAKGSVIYKGFLCRAMGSKDSVPECFELKRRAKGHYACIFHHDTDEGHARYTLSFIQSLKEQGFKIQSDIFTYYDAFYLQPMSDNSYLLRYEIKV